MGSCKICHKPTKFNYPLCWQHYYFNLNSGRFWFAFILTVIWEFLINLSIITEEGLMIMLINSLFDVTNFIGFLIGSITIQILIFIGSLMFMNYFVYKYFYSKKAIRWMWQIFAIFLIKLNYYIFLLTVSGLNIEIRRRYFYKSILVCT